MLEDQKLDQLNVGKAVQVLDAGLWFDATVDGHELIDGITFHRVKYSKKSWMKVSF